MVSSSESREAPRRPATMKDVALLAGVSTGLASMALAGSSRVASTTRETVHRAAEQLDYVPNSTGRALRSQRLGAIAVVIPHSSQHVFSHPYFTEVLQGVTDVANSHDLTVVLSTSRQEEDEEAAYLKVLRSRRADGVIVAAAAMKDRNVARLASSGYPVVFLGRDPGDARITTIGVDDRAAAEQATAHLIGFHQLHRVAHLTGPLAHQSAADKLDGYRAALHRHNLPFDERLVIQGDYSQESAFHACGRLLDAGDRIDGLFAANDEMALGCLEALHHRHLEVPGDVALVGFDDIGLAKLVQPALTTVHQPMTEIGRVAAEQLIRMLNGDVTEPAHIEIPTEIIIRSSCGCQPRREAPAYAGSLTR